MAKFFSLLAFTLLQTAVFAQSNFDRNLSGGNAFANDINGRPMYLKTEYTADGSPYLYEEYCLAEVTMLTGKVYDNVRAKINLQEKLLIYPLDNGMDMILTSPISKIKFYSIISQGKAFPERTFKGHGKALNDPGGEIYEVLYEDSASTLLKRVSVTYTDSKAYGEATITRSFRRSTSYFAAVPSSDKELAVVEKDPKRVSALFGSKTALIKSFIDQKKLKCKSEDELIEVFRYYGSL
ncbi:MAG: hypothetical protein J7527_01810 [Chitinophagaceae bacterium]|nr:hypothetical protein [Chitinophagaceae bacterium]